jgi:septum formation topological specificity factor MinE
MADINFISNDDIEKYLKIILTQTNYDEPIARDKLKEFNYDYMKVIRNYMGITEKKQPNKIGSINQEIYRQIRHNLDSGMKNYREQNPINIEQVINNFIEADEKIGDNDKN